MKLTRRNALIGLGSLVAGSGALVGTGAFSSVEADRTVSLQTSSDSGAALSLDSGNGASEIITTETADNTSDSVLKINKTDLNADAKTTFSAALEVDNNNNQKVGFWVSEDNTNAATVSDTGVLQFENSSGTNIVENSPTTANETLAGQDTTGQTEQITIIVDATKGNPANFPSQVTLNADTSAAGNV